MKSVIFSWLNFIIFYTINCLIVYSRVKKCKVHREDCSDLPCCVPCEILYALAVILDSIPDVYFSASLPQVFIPTVMATNKVSGEKVFGVEAFRASVRSESILSYPIRPSNKVDKVRNMGILKKICVWYLCNVEPLCKSHSWSEHEMAFVEGWPLQRSAFSKESGDASG